MLGPGSIASPIRISVPALFLACYVSLKFPSNLGSSVSLPGTRGFNPAPWVWGAQQRRQLCYKVGYEAVHTRFRQDCGDCGPRTSSLSHSLPFLLLISWLSDPQSQSAGGDGIFSGLLLSSTPAASYDKRIILWDIGVPNQDYKFQAR